MIALTAIIAKRERDKRRREATRHINITTISPDIGIRVFWGFPPWTRKRMIDLFDEADRRDKLRKKKRGDNGQADD
jgi:hypothetical protein